MKTRGPEGFSVCLSGVPGVGKTMLLHAHVTEREPRDRQITGSSVVKGIIAPASVRDLDTWPETKREEVREESIRRLRIQRRETAGRLLVDGHFTLRNRATGVIEPIFTPGDRAFFDAVALIEAPIEQVLAWRQGDTRDRGAETPEQITAHLDAERAEGERLAREMGVPYLIVTVISLPARLDALAAFLDEHAFLGAP